MSVRPKEAFEASQTFSLRAALGANAPAPPATTNGGLRFDLATLAAEPKTASPDAQEQAPVPFASTSIGGAAGLSLRFACAPVVKAKDSNATTFTAQPAHGSLPNLSFASMTPAAGGPRMLMLGQHAAVQAKEAANTKADVMRLSAYVDELTQRLRKTQGKLDQTEVQLTRTSQMLCQERQATETMLSGYKKDLAMAHETEAKLRADIASSKKRAPLHDSAFMTSVGSALASDEQILMQQRNLQELETKVNAMGDFKVKLESEVAQLEALRTEAEKKLLDLKAANEQHSKAATASCEAADFAKRELQEAKASHSDILERLAAAKVEEATIAEALDNIRASTRAAEQAKSQAQQETEAMLMEHSDASRCLADVKKRVAALCEQENDAAQRLDGVLQRAATTAAGVPLLEPSEGSTDAMSEFELEPPMSAMMMSARGEPPPARRMTVTGAAAPKRALCLGIADSKTGILAHAPLSGSGVAAVLNTDAPADLTLKRIGYVGERHCVLMGTAATDASPGKQQEDPTALMVNAVVTDLKQKLTEISQRQPVWRQVAPLA